MPYCIEVLLPSVFLPYAQWKVTPEKNDEFFAEMKYSKICLVLRALAAVAEDWRSVPGTHVR